MGFTNKNALYEENRARLIEQSKYTMADAIKETEAENAAAEKAAAKAAAPKHYRYQPKDGSGRPIGAPIVLTYNDDADLTAQLNILTTTARGMTAEVDADFPATVQRFVNETPDYCVNDHNFQTICAAATTLNLPMNLENLKTVFTSCLEQGKLRDNNGSVLRATSTSQSSAITWTLPNGKVVTGEKALDAMPVHIYQEKMKDPSFRKLADKALAGWNSQEMLDKRFYGRGLNTTV